MIDQNRLKVVLDKYKKDFIGSWWENEKYKWVAVKHFQDHWDVNATDFADMLKNSLAKTINLLASTNNYPRAAIEKMAQDSPEEVKAMFLELFDESKDVYDRIHVFKQHADNLHEKFGESGKQHFQNENSISTYLWLRYPDKYYIFKYSEVKETATVLQSNYTIKKGAYAKNIRNSIQLYDEICVELQKDGEIIEMLRSRLTEDCYVDPQLRTMAIDVGYYINNAYNELSEEEWFPVDYSPGLTVEDWLQLLKDQEVFTKDSLEIMKRMKDHGGQATCTQLSDKYGKTKAFYNVGSSSLARRIADKTGCPVMPHEEGSLKGDIRWWPILYVGRKAEKGDEGVYIWKLRDELSTALENIDLSGVDLYASKPVTDEGNYWWLNANPKIWSFSDIAVGETQAYTFFSKNNYKRRIFRNFLDAKIGDMIIGYESNPVKKVVALARIVDKQDGKNLTFEIVAQLVAPIDYSTLKACSELEEMEFFINPNGSLFKLSKEEYDFIMDLIHEENPIEGGGQLEQYTKEDFLSEVYMTESRFNTLTSVLKNKKNIILQGAPGVGKTFAANKLAYAIMGEKDDSRIEFIQFHQNYSYEDFMMGYKPVSDGFELKHGIFYQFCQKAKNQIDKDHFFIIDEINRGNMSKIFGELLMLIEKDYRGTKATLAYNGLKFSVPENVHIIGMMNTADRSLAMIDYALRRRFSFFDMEPGFDSEGFIQYQKGLNNELFDDLVLKVQELNKEIAMDKSLGKGFSIGHSYFCGQKTCNEVWLQAIVDYDILPMLREYWFDDDAKLLKWENILHGVFQ